MILTKRLFLDSSTAAERREEAISAAVAMVHRYQERREVTVGIPPISEVKALDETDTSFFVFFTHIRMMVHVHGKVLDNDSQEWVINCLVLRFHSYSYGWYVRAAMDENGVLIDIPDIPSIVAAKYNLVS